MASTSTELEAENRALRARLAASAEVLGAISASLDNPQPVFELIARHARVLCDAGAVLVTEFDGTLLHMRALDGGDAAMLATLRAAYPRTPAPDFFAGRAALTGDVVHLRNIAAEAGLHQFVHDVGEHSGLGVPLRRNGQVLGAMVLSRSATGDFDDGKIALIRSFADQAVIALSSAATLRELRARTADLAQRNSEYGERIEQQAATIDVLNVMSSSPGDAHPVFDLIARRALEFCGATAVRLTEFDGERQHLRALVRADGPETEAAAAIRRLYPAAPDADSISGRVIRHGKIVHARDPSQVPAGMRGRYQGSVVGVPLPREGRVVGVILLSRAEAGGFSDTQVELLQTFAEQAVIAISSAETYRTLEARTTALTRRNSEYSEQIAHQSATIDVLKAMSASPGDAQPVFDLIVRRAAEVCNAPNAVLFLYDGELLHWRATAGAEVYASPEAFAAIRQRFPMPPSRTSLAGRVVLDRRLIHIRNIDDEPDLYQALYDINTKSLLSVPLLRDGAVLGVIGLSAREAGGFSDSQVALLETFAEQAVIAIASAETYRALQERTVALAQRNSEFGERIEQQSATIDVLKAMSASPGDTQPVFDLIVRHTLRACNGMSAALFEYDGKLVHSRTWSGGNTAAVGAFHAIFPRPLSREYLVGRAILDKQTIHVRDIDSEPGVLPEVRAMGGRTTLSMPLLRDGEAIGAIALNARDPGGFTDSQVALLQTFAEQAVIAITSAETYRALHERTAALAQRNMEYGERIEQQEATIDVLRTMSASPGDTQPVFDLIVEHAADLCAAQMASLALYDGAMMHLAAHSGMDPDGASSYAAQFPRPAGTDSTLGRAILSGQVVQIEDLGADPLYVMPRRRNASRSTMAQPLLRDGTPIGAILIGRQQPGPFSTSQVALLQVFAEQAVIAITSAGTFHTLRERTEALSRSVSELQALEEVLRAVNSSLDLETVLATIISRAVRLSVSDEGTIYEFDPEEEIFVPKSAFGMSDERVALLRERRIRLGETHLGRSAVLRAPVAVNDVQQDPSVPNAAEVLPGIHAVLAVPLLREDTVIGGLVIRRRSEEGFAPTLVTLMQTFAGQAVLAIENARLFQEARQARTAAEIALADLRRAQDRLVQSEKMASLGQLTAGIAHEIKNPLNFVNNFSQLSRDLLDELKDAMIGERQGEIEELVATLKGNLEKIEQHGKRADSIVKNMLSHSRSGPSEHRSADLNAIVEEALNLAYHGARAETSGFNITMQKQLDPAAGMVELYPQEFIRVMVNLINNGFYAARSRAAEPGFEPTLRLTTRDHGDYVEICVRDNGSGISAAVKSRIFEPFFTTKPAGEGTGLGLSLSYDIVVKQHGGQLTVNSEVDEFTEFLITLPRKMAANDGGQA